VAKIWVQEVLIKDVLDQWGGKSNTETEFVIVCDSSQTDKSAKNQPNDEDQPISQ
jgi:hypothetical protein